MDYSWVVRGDRLSNLYVGWSLYHLDCLSFIHSFIHSFSHWPATISRRYELFTISNPKLAFLVSKGDKQSKPNWPSRSLTTIIKPVADSTSPNLHLHLGGPLMILCLNLLLGSKQSIFTSSLRCKRPRTRLAGLFASLIIFARPFPSASTILIFHIDRELFDRGENWQESIFARKDVTLPRIRSECRFESELNSRLIQPNNDKVFILLIQAGWTTMMMMMIQSVEMEWPGTTGLGVGSWKIEWMNMLINCNREYYHDVAQETINK